MTIMNHWLSITIYLILIQLFVIKCTSSWQPYHCGRDIIELNNITRVIDFEESVYIMMTRTIVQLPRPTMELLDAKYYSIMKDVNAIDNNQNQVIDYTIVGYSWTWSWVDKMMVAKAQELHRKYGGIELVDMILDKPPDIQNPNGKIIDDEQDFIFKIEFNYNNSIHYEFKYSYERVLTITPMRNRKITKSVELKLDYTIKFASLSYNGTEETFFLTELDTKLNFYFKKFKRDAIGNFKQWIQPGSKTVNAVLNCFQRPNSLDEFKGIYHRRSTGFMIIVNRFMITTNFDLGFTNFTLNETYYENATELRSLSWTGNEKMNKNEKFWEPNVNLLKVRNIIRMERPIVYPKIYDEKEIYYEGWNSLYRMHFDFSINQWYFEKQSDEIKKEVDLCPGNTLTIDFYYFCFDKTHYYNYNIPSKLDEMNNSTGKESRKFKIVDLFRVHKSFRDYKDRLDDLLFMAHYQEDLVVWFTKRLAYIVRINAIYVKDLKHMELEIVTKSYYQFRIKIHCLFSDACLPEQSTTEYKELVFIASFVSIWLFLFFGCIVWFMFRTVRDQKMSFKESLTIIKSKQISQRLENMRGGSKASNSVDVAKSSQMSQSANASSTSVKSDKKPIDVQLKDKTSSQSIAIESGEMFRSGSLPFESALVEMLKEVPKIDESKKKQDSKKSKSESQNDDKKPKEESSSTSSKSKEQKNQIDQSKKDQSNDKKIKSEPVDDKKTKSESIDDKITNSESISDKMSEIESVFSNPQISGKVNQPSLSSKSKKSKKKRSKKSSKKDSKKDN